jgi:small subunit ribosomal protein S18
MKKFKSKKDDQSTYKALQMQTQKNRMRKKIDPLKSRNITFIDYRDTRLLSRFLNEQGKILPNRITGVSSKMQRKITLAIKRARHLALMPFVSEEFRN